MRSNIQTFHIRNGNENANHCSFVCLLFCGSEKVERITLLSSYLMPRFVLLFAVTVVVIYLNASALDFHLNKCIHA